MWMSVIAKAIRPPNRNELEARQDRECRADPPRGLSAILSLFAALVHVLPHPSRTSCFTRLVGVLEVQAVRFSFQHLPYQVEGVAQCNEGVFTRRIIDDLIYSKAKDLRGTAVKAGYINLYRGAEFNDDLSFFAFRVPENEMPFGNNPS